MKFALCGAACHNEPHIHHHEHVHFHCTECQQTVCINEVDVPQLSLPAGFTPQKFSFIIEGKCQNCQNS
jgi:Fur family ferric uptake transcriptional regulator